MENNLLNEDEQPYFGTFVDDLLKKYGLNEDLRKAYQKIKDGIQPNKTIISYLSKDLADGKITEKDLAVSIQKNFNTSPEITQGIIDEIKRNVVPLMKKIPAIREEKREVAGIKKDDDIFPKIKPALEIDRIPQPEITAPKKPARIATQSDSGGEAREKSTLPKKLRRPFEPGEIIHKPIQKSGPDNYREPIG